MCHEKAEEMRELSVHVKVRNNVLYHAIYDVWDSTAEFCRRSGMSPSRIAGFMTLRLSPFTTRGVYTDEAKKVADALGMVVHELFPGELYAHSVEELIAEFPVDENFKNRVRELIHTQELSASNFDDARQALEATPSLSDVEGDLEQVEMAREIEYALRDLSDRERKVLELSFGLNGHEPHTHLEIGAKLSVTRDRIRMIEAQALRKLRHPSLSRWLAGCLD